MRGAIIFFRLILTAIFLLFLILSFSTLSQAQETSTNELGTLDDLNVAIEVQDDSSIKIVQEFTNLSLYSSSFVWQIDANNLKGLEIEENGMKIDSSQIKIQGGDLTRLTFPLTYFSSTDLKISYQSWGNLKVVNNKLLLKNIIFNRPGIYINNLRVKLILPLDAAKAQEGQRFYAIHGIENSSQKMLDDTDLFYEARNSGSYSSFTIEDSFLCDTIRFPLAERIKFFFDNLSAISLISISLPLPLITLLVLAWFDFRYRRSVKIRRNLPASNNLPNEIPPALLDLLYQGDITPNGVSATILDLIKKGTVLIVDKGEVTTFGRKSSSHFLQPFEEKILNELFKQQKIKTSISELKKIGAEELVDPIFERVYHEIYQIGSAKGYFERNPYRAKILNHLLGIVLFFLSTVFFVLVIIFFPVQPLMLLPPFGMTAASLLILYLAKNIPSRTAKGKLELEKWLSFKKYLLGHHPITDEKELTLKYLPQAEALGATEDWISHFKNLPTQTPSFYVSAMPYVATAEWMVRTVNVCRGMAEEIEELKGY